MTTAGGSSVYNGRYELRSQIARGGTAQVYLAHDLLLDRPVALKVLFPELSSDRSFVERFRREAQAAANLSHPNIVSVFDWGESDSTYFIVMEYIDGEALSSIIHRHAPLEPGQAASIAADIAKALAYAHRHGVVHRDVKPGNVLITSDGQVKVTDFGIARAIGVDEQVTQTGLVMGTATYFSPEQAQGLGVDGRSDIYSLGVVLYEMVTGRPPFTGDTPVSIAYQHVQERPPPPRSFNPAVPAALEAIIGQAMAKLPAARYPTAEDFRADLDRFVRGQTVLAAPPRDGGPLTEAMAPLGGGGDATTAMAISGPPEYQRRPTTTRYWTIAGVLLLVAIALIVVFGGRSLGYFGGAKYFTVPKVVHEQGNTAEAQLTADGLKVSTSQVPGSADASNEVISQQPAFPAQVKRGQTVHLQIAGAVPTASVPSVLGQQKSAAQSQLQQAGFQVKVKNVQPTDPSQVENQVIAQNPTGNATAPKGSKVTISVVKTNKVPVPTLTGDNEAQAGAALSHAGFNLGTVSQAFSSTVPNLDVISSDPAAGTLVLQSTPVNLVISQGAGVTVPNLLGDSASQAQAALQQLGLLGSQGASYPTSVSGYQGNVAWYQANGLAANTTGQVPPGTTVDYRIGRPPVSVSSTTTTLVGNTGVPTTTTTPLPTTTTSFP